MMDLVAANEIARADHLACQPGAPARQLRIVASALGSRGDVHPVLAVASRLRRLGHHLELIVPADFVEDARRVGFEPHSYEMNIAELSRQLKTNLVGISQVFRWFLGSVARNADSLLAIAEGADLLLTSTAELHGPTVAEALGVPHLRMAFAPVLPGERTPPVLPLPELPAPLGRALWFGMNEGMMLVLGRQLNRLRRRLGLPRVTHLGTHLHGHCRTLLAFSSKLAPPEPGWAWDYRYCGYCFADQEPATLPQAVEEFLATGDRPVYLGFGSIHIREPRRFADLLVEAVKRSGVRVLLSRGWQGLDAALPGRMLTVGELDHRALFPRLAGVCHHGGCGTTHTAAHAGVPQFVMPHALDQYFWGRRVLEHGLGPRPTSPQRLDADRLATALWQLVRDAGYRTRAEELERSLQSEQGTSAAAQIVEDAVNPQLSRGVLTC